MGRDNTLNTLKGLLRKVARSRVSGSRRLAAIDQLADIDNVYRLSADTPFVPTPAHALQIVKSLLSGLMKDPKVSDRVKAKAVDRIAFIRGRSIAGLVKTEAIAMQSKRSVLQSLRAEVDELLKGSK